MAPRVKPIPLRLNPDIKFEAALREQYDARPRARRQEFLRQILRLGWDAWVQGSAAGAAVAALRESVQQAAPVASLAASAPVAPAIAAAPVPAAESAPAPASTVESTKSLRGFFGEAQQSIGESNP